jgi:hypothetical protein
VAALRSWADAKGTVSAATEIKKVYMQAPCLMRYDACMLRFSAFEF